MKKTEQRVQRLWKHIVLGLFAAVCMVLLSNVTTMAADVYTCEYDGVKYTSLRQAVKSVSADGTANIKMISDEIMTNFVQIGSRKNISLDLAGYHINYPDSDKYTAIEIDSGTFTLNDSVGGGTISAGNAEFGMILVFGGHFIMNGGSIVHNENPSSNERGIYAVQGSITINGGTISTKSPFLLDGVFNSLIDITINGGTFIAQNSCIIRGQVNANIKGGTFLSEKFQALEISFVKGYPIPTVKLSGGKYEGKDAGILISQTNLCDGFTITDIIEKGYYLSDATIEESPDCSVYTAKDVKILPLLSDENVVISGIRDMIYTGKKITMPITVNYNGETNLKEGTDYEIEYLDNLEAGIATVKIVFKNKYVGTIIKNFNINIKITDENVAVTGIQNATYTGSRIEQKNIKVSYDKKTLVKGTDYTIDYTSNLNAGTATIKFTFKGNYTGKIARTFKIEKANQKIKLTAANYMKSATASDFNLGAKLAIGDGKISYSCSSTSIAKVDEKGNVSLTGKYGTATITVKSIGTKNYLTEKRTVKITVKPKQMQKPSLILKAAGKVQVKWSVDKNASGYEVKYATNSEFKGPKTKLVSGASQYSTTISGLTKGKTYYVKIRAYKNINGEKVYGQYSNVVKILIK